MALNGFQVAGIRERQSIGPAGNLQNEVIIDLLTDFGNTGTLVLTQREYESLTNDELREKLVAKVMKLDRAKLITDTDDLDDE